MTKKLLFGLFILSLFIAPLSTHALTPFDPNQQKIAELLSQITVLQEQLRQLQGQQSGQWCWVFNSNLGVGARGGDAIKSLQKILVTENLTPYSDKNLDVALFEYGDGYIPIFGKDTLSYVKKFQTKYGIPNTGYVGPLTRAKLNALYKCPPITGNQPPTISGVSGPTTLRIGETGTWTVRASDPENESVNYYVHWGDEVATSWQNSGSQLTQTIPSIQQISSFTHTYAQSGTYQPIFYVSDNVNQTSYTSISVTVTQNSNSPITVTSPNGGEQWMATPNPNIEQWMSNYSRIITWRYDGATSATKVDLYLDAEPPACAYSNPPCLMAFRESYVLDKNISAQGTYNWIVATGIVNNPIPSGNYKVRICEAGSQTNCDSSDNYFTISSKLTNSDPDIQKLLSGSIQWLSVIVGIQGNQYTTPEFQDDVVRKREIKKLQDAVAVTLGSGDVRGIGLYDYIPFFSGQISKSGLDKLLNNPSVTSISVDRPIPPAN